MCVTYAINMLLAFTTHFQRLITIPNRNGQGDERSQHFCLLFLIPPYPPKQSTLEFINKDICAFGACSDQLSHIFFFFGAGKKVYCLNANAYGSLILMWCSRDNYFSWTGMSLAKKVEHIQNSADFSAANSGWGFFLPCWTHCQM